MGSNKDEIGGSPDRRGDRSPTDPGDAPGAAPQRDAWLKALTGPWVGQSFTLGPKNLIGRSRDADLCLEDDSVSRRHAEIDKIGRIWVLRDLGSVNGTLVNGKEISGQVELWDGDVIRLGDIELAYQDTIGRHRAVAAAPPGTDEVPEVFVRAGFPTGRVIAVGCLTLAIAVAAFIGMRRPRASRVPKLANSAPSVPAKVEKQSELPQWL